MAYYYIIGLHTENNEFEMMHGELTRKEAEFELPAYEDDAAYEHVAIHRAKDGTPETLQELLDSLDKGYKDQRRKDVLSVVDMTCELIDKRTDGFMSEGDRVHWKVTLTCKGFSFEVFFTEGIAHFAKVPFMGSMKLYQHDFVQMLVRNRNHRFTHYSSREWKDCTTDRSKIAHNRPGAGWHKCGTQSLHTLWIKQPSIESVMYSLAMECDALEYCFSDWCDNLGYNCDSISHKAIYDKCLEQAHNVKKLGLDIPELQALFQDY